MSKRKKPTRKPKSRVLTVGLPKIDPVKRRATGKVQRVAFVDERDRAALEGMNLLPNIAQLLTDSIAAHQRYRALGTVKAAGALDAIREARTLRQQAHDADPDHADPGWAATGTKYPHDALMVFYAEKLRG